MTCRGKGSIFNTVKETITIPKGVDNGVNLRVSKKGHFSPVGPAGDLMVQIKVKPHAYFKRDGSDILTDQYITVSQAVLGADLNVKTLYGDIKMKVDPGTQNEEKKKIANYVSNIYSLSPPLIGCPKVAPEPSSKREPLCHR
jgi:molecular chaperone DnaJ